MKLVQLTAAVALGLSFGVGAYSQNARSDEKTPVAEQAAAPALSDKLSIEQARLADRFKRLEEALGRLAEFSASSDPRRAKVLREAIARSREEDISVRFESIVKLLEDERLSAAATNQTELQQELESILNVLLKAERDKELSSQRDQVKKYLKEVARLIRVQKGVRARTEGGDELHQLSEDQQRVASDTGKLRGDVSKTEKEKKGAGQAADGGDSQSNDSDTNKENETPKHPDQDSRKQGDEPNGGDPSRPSDPSKPGDSSKPGEPGKGQPGEGKPSEPNDTPPSDSGRPSQGQPGQRQPGQGQPGQQSEGENSDSEQQPPKAQDPADRAARRLQDAQERMEQARKKLDEAKRDGAAEQQRQALRALEQAKAELERILRQLREEELERTLTQLAARFRKMLESQNQVYEGTVRLNEVPADNRDHDHEIEAARLSRQESEIVHEADKALLLLREEGSSVAFPETVEQLRDDMRRVVERLAGVKVGTITQGLEQDIIASLEETISALEKAIKDLDKKRTPRGQAAQPGQPSEPPLVDKLAELKMIRALQMRINKRTQQYGKMIQGEQAEAAELIEALNDLAERQRRVYQATADLEKGRND